MVDIIMFSIVNFLRLRKKRFLSGLKSQVSSLIFYEFTDTNGDTIACELDDDRNWSHVKKDALVEISAEIDKGYTKLELEVFEVRPVK